jgi:hypothetical protein
MKIKCQNNFSKNIKKVLIPKNPNNHFNMVNIYPVIKRNKGKSNLECNYETVNFGQTFNKNLTKKKTIKKINNNKSNNKVVNIIWARNLKNKIIKEENEIFSELNYSNFLNYNLGNIEQDFDDEFITLNIDEFTKNIIEKKNNDEYEIEFDEQEKFNSIIEDKETNDTIDINTNINNNIKKFFKSKSNINKLNLSSSKKNNSNYVLNIEEFSPNEKLNNVYNFSKFPMMSD